MLRLNFDFFFPVLLEYPQVSAIRSPHLVPSNIFKPHKSPRIGQDCTSFGVQELPMPGIALVPATNTSASAATSTNHQPLRSFVSQTLILPKPEMEANWGLILSKSNPTWPPSPAVKVRRTYSRSPCPTAVHPIADLEEPGTQGHHRAIGCQRMP